MNNLQRAEFFKALLVRNYFWGIFKVGRAAQLTEHLKNYDRELYCEKNSMGKLCVFRNSKRWELFDLGEQSLWVARSAPYLIFTLTHDWSPHGEAVDWGYMPIIQRIQQMDNWNRSVVEDVIDQHEKHEASRNRDVKNKIEAGVAEMYPHFKKTFSDIRTANMSKKEKRREKCL
jgi:hypothetical protein